MKELFRLEEAGLQRQSDTYSSRLDGQHRDIWIIAIKTSIDSNFQNRLITFIGAKFLERFFYTWQTLRVVICGICRTTTSCSKEHEIQLSMRSFKA
jgi:hypothetical protein